jgi:hypothetical protein
MRLQPIASNKWVIFRFGFWVVLPCATALMMEAARNSETSVDNYFTRQYNPEDKSELHTRRRENLKSHNMNDKWKIHFKGYGRNRTWHKFMALSQCFPGITEEKHETLSQYSLSPSRYLNTGPPEYEAGVLTTRPRRSVWPHLSVCAARTSILEYCVGFPRNMLLENWDI